ncbi:hypothetical protein HKBW3S06_01697, partial [Candidatus Hakubella thermalkaliphila]
SKDLDAFLFFIGDERDRTGGPFSSPSFDPLICSSLIGIGEVGRGKRELVAQTESGQITPLAAELKVDGRKHVPIAELGDNRTFQGGYPSLPSVFVIELSGPDGRKNIQSHPAAGKENRAYYCRTQLPQCRIYLPLESRAGFWRPVRVELSG